MPILALKPFEFRRVKYAAGDALPEGILRSTELREMQRRGYVHPRASVEMARAPREVAPQVEPVAPDPTPARRRGRR